MLPNLPDRKPMFDGNGFPTVPTRVWWQAVGRAFGEERSGFAGGIRRLSASGSAAQSDYLVLADATAAAMTVTLPPVASSARALIVVKKIDTSSHHVTVEGSGAETIDGAANVTIVHRYDSATFACDGAQWWLT
jgi:hypothetical protein